MTRFSAALLAVGSLFAAAPASAAIFTTADFAPIQLGSGGPTSALSQFDFNIEVADDQFVDGLYQYSFRDDAYEAFFSHSPLNTDVPEFSLSFAADPQSGIGSVSSAGLSALNGTNLSAADAFLNDLTVLLRLGANGAVEQAQISAVLQAATIFNIRSFGDDVFVQVASDSGLGGCFQNACVGTASVVAGSVSAPAGTLFIALAGLLAFRRKSAQRD